MSSFRHLFLYYRANAEGRLTHCAANDAGRLPFKWIEIEQTRKPEPTEAQLDSPHTEADLFGEPQIKEHIRVDLEQFRDLWLPFWASPLPVPFDPAVEAENLNPFANSITASFINSIVSYPRILLASGFVQLGGTQIVGPLRPPKGWPYAKQKASAHEANRGAIDLAVSLFKDHLRIVGQHCECTSAAIEAIGRLDSLLGWMNDVSGFSNSNIEDFCELRHQLDNALHAMCIAVAKHADNHPATAEKKPTLTDISQEELISTLQRGLSPGKSSSRRRNKPDMKVLSALTRSKIYEAWTRFKKCDPKNLRNSRDKPWSSPVKRTYAGFLSFHAESLLFNETMTGHPVFLKDVVTKVCQLKRIIHAESQREREREASEALRKRKARRDETNAAEAES